MLATFRIHKNKDNPYIVLNKGLLLDKNLSWRAKGILAYLLSKPDDWMVRAQDIENQSREARRAVMTAISELIGYGYVSKRIDRESGRFKSFEYDVFESPKLNPDYHYIVGTPLCTNGTMVGNKVENYHDKVNQAHEQALKEDVEQAGLKWSEDMRKH